MDVEKILYLKELKEKNSMTVDEYKNRTFTDNQIVGLREEEGVVVEVVNFSAEELKEEDIKYADVKEQFENMDFYHQRLTEDLVIDTESNLEILEKHEETKTRKNMIANRNTRKATNSVKGADGRKLR